MRWAACVKLRRPSFGEGGHELVQRQGQGRRAQGAGAAGLSPRPVRGPPRPGQRAQSTRTDRQGGRHGEHRKVDLDQGRPDGQRGPRDRGQGRGQGRASQQPAHGGRQRRRQGRGQRQDRGGDRARGRQREGQRADRDPGHRDRGGRRRRAAPGGGRGRRRERLDPDDQADRAPRARPRLPPPRCARSAEAQARAVRVRRSR